jgi:hypothetical protein
VKKHGEDISSLLPALERIIARAAHKSVTLHDGGLTNPSMQRVDSAALDMRAFSYEQTTGMDDPSQP